MQALAHNSFVIVDTNFHVAAEELDAHVDHFFSQPHIPKNLFTVIDAVIRGRQDQIKEHSGNADAVISLK